MRPTVLETRVLAAVDKIRSGVSVENDFIECKRDWPQDSKVRQLAASLNRAGGEPVIYIIGIDEDSGEIFDVTGTEVSDWWNQITPKFDQRPPEMIRHMTVPIEDGKSVVAVAFASDRAPYVVKTGVANPSLEVPMREGTSTRTAKRDELLRLLMPAVLLPQVVVLEVSLYSEYYPPKSPNGGTEEFSSIGQLRVYLEHTGPEAVTMPAHGMRGRATIGERRFDMEVQPPTETAQVPAGTVTHSFQRPSDGVTVDRPRAVPFSLTLKNLSPEDRFLLAKADSIDVEIELEVLHSIKPLRIQAALSRDKDSTLHKASSLDDVYGGSVSAGTWRFKHPGVSVAD
jgi:hypothetical protein